MTGRGRLPYGVLAAAVASLVVLAPAPTDLAAQQVSLATVDSLIQVGRTDEAREILGRWMTAVGGNAPRLDLQRSLWMRAVLTVDPEQAAFDLRRLVVEYPGGGWSDQALLRLGQLAEARGDAVLAASHYRALLRDYPTSPARLVAREWLEENAEGVARAEREAATPVAPEPIPIEPSDPQPAPEPIPAEPPTGDPIEEASPRTPEAETAPRAAPDTAPAARPAPETPPTDPPTPVPVEVTPAETAPPTSRAAVARGGAPEEGGPVRPAPDTASPEPLPPDTLGRERLARVRPTERPAEEPDVTPEVESDVESVEAPAGDTAVGQGEEPATESAGTGDFTVQVGAFASEARARTLLADLRAAGFDARVVAMPESELVRVRVGRFPDPEEATRAYDRIVARGFEAAVVADAAREIAPGGEAR